MRVRFAGSRALGRTSGTPFVSSAGRLFLLPSRHCLWRWALARIRRVERQHVGFQRENILLVRTDAALAGYQADRLFPVFREA